LSSKETASSRLRIVRKLLDLRARQKAIIEEIQILRKELSRESENVAERVSPPAEVVEIERYRPLAAEVAGTSAESPEET
jgi:hypothetical protein